MGTFLEDAQKGQLDGAFAPENPNTAFSLAERSSAPENPAELVYVKTLTNY